MAPATSELASVLSAPTQERAKSAQHEILRIQVVRTILPLLYAFLPSCLIHIRTTATTDIPSTIV
jgi:hypothetical protein